MHRMIPEWGVSATRMHKWRNIFFFEGLITILIAIAAYFYLFNTPDSCSFLTAREKVIATERIRRDNLEDPDERTEMVHVKRGIININSCLCAFGFFLINVSAQSFSLFIPTILLALGWTSTRAQLLTVPPYVVASVWCIFVSWLSDRVNRRGVFVVAHAAFCAMGYMILVTATTANIKYMATFFCAIGAYPLGPIFLTWGLNSMPFPPPRHTCT